MEWARELWSAVVFARDGKVAKQIPHGGRGGINLYCMYGNDAVNQWNYLGLDHVVVAEGTSVKAPNGHDKPVGLS